MVESVAPAPAISGGPTGSVPRPRSSSRRVALPAGQGSLLRDGERIPDPRAAGRSAVARGARGGAGLPSADASILGQPELARASGASGWAPSLFRSDSAG